MKINQHRYDKIRFISNGNIDYNGERIIDQFSIGNIHSEATYSNASTELKVIIPMSRIAINQFLNTFFPTVILWLFGYSTLFIEPNENGFANRFMGSGTALLVMATLINAVKGDLPKTAYMKFIDNQGRAAASRANISATRCRSGEKKPRTAALWFAP